jgi:hypothetical protein
MSTSHFVSKIGIAALISLPIVASQASSAAERVRGVAGKNGGAIVCLAGCDSAPPVVVGRAPMTPTRPLPQPSSEDVSYRMRNVWCGNGGSCVAVNHIAPPRLRDSYDPSIAVFHYRRW